MTVLWECPSCRTAYRLRLFRCPRCHGTDVKEETMPKISRHGGVSSVVAGRVQEAAARSPATGGTVQETLVVGEDGPAATVLPEHEHPGTGVPMEGIEVPADGAWSPEISGDGSGQALPLADSEGGEQPSPGSNSETSPERPPSSPVTSETAPPKRARTTGSRSRKARTGSSTAGSTASSGEAEKAS